MPVFKLQPEGFNAIRKKVLLLIIPISLVALLAGLCVPLMQQHEDESVATWVFIVPALLVFMGFGIFRTMKKQQASWNTFELRLENETFTRKQLNMPELSIRAADLKEISQTSDGALMLKAGNLNQTIIVPAAVQNREELLALLQHYGPVTEKPVPNRTWLAIPIGLASIAAFFLFFYSMNKWVVAPTGILLLALLIYSFISIHKSKHMDRKVKRASYWSLFLLFIIVMKLLFVLIWN